VHPANRPQLPAEIEEYRDAHWQREETARVETVLQAEQFIERVGFTACLTDTRRPGPSLYVAVCGRRDAILPRNVQKDPECSQTWTLKDQVMRRGRFYYGKFGRRSAMFVAPRMIPYFNALWGMRKRAEKKHLSRAALAVLKVLRKEWEMGTADLRAESGVSDRKTYLKAMDELQAAMIVIPSEVVYDPKFTYLWALAEERFPEELSRRIDRRTAFLTEYQDRAYAARYLALVNRVREAEAACLPGNTTLTDTVARALFKLMAYKDEYEVARLYTETDFLKRVADRFNGPYELHVHLAPPLLGDRDPQTGHLRKRTFGPWMLSVFRILAKLRRLRGTPFDIFGRSEERRTERRLIGEYETVLAEILTDLSPSSHAVAVEIAALPLEIRGFGHIKEANLARAKAREAVLFTRFRSRRPPHALAAE